MLDIELQIVHSGYPALNRLFTHELAVAWLGQPRRHIAIFRDFCDLAGAFMCI